MDLEEKYKDIIADYIKMGKDNDDFEGGTFDRRKYKYRNKFEDDYMEPKKEKRNKKNKNRKYS